jgi:hypothetical protein
MQISGSSFEGFRAAGRRWELFANEFGFSLNMQKNRRQNSAAESSCQYSVNLLANDAGIIFRQSKASLMLLL